MRTLTRSLLIAGTALFAATFSTASLADRGHGRGHWKHDRFDEHCEERVIHRHHRHRHFDERVVFIRERAPVYYTPAPVYYAPARPVVTRPVVTISTPDIIIPF